MAQKTNVRERLLAAAFETLHKSGFNATGVQDFSYLRAGTAYTFTATTETGAVSTVTATTTSETAPAAPPR